MTPDPASGCTISLLDQPPTSGGKAAKGVTTKPVETTSMAVQAARYALQRATDELVETVLIGRAQACKTVLLQMIEQLESLRQLRRRHQLVWDPSQTSMAEMPCSTSSAELPITATARGQGQQGVPLQSNKAYRQAFFDLLAQIEIRKSAVAEIPARLSVVEEVSAPAEAN